MSVSWGGGGVFRILCLGGGHWLSDTVAALGTISDHSKENDSERIWNKKVFLTVTSGVIISIVHWTFVRTSTRIEVIHENRFSLRSVISLFVLWLFLISLCLLAVYFTYIRYCTLTLPRCKITIKSIFLNIYVLTYLVLINSLVCIFCDGVLEIILVYKLWIQLCCSYLPCCL